MNLGPAVVWALCAVLVLGPLVTREVRLYRRRRNATRDQDLLRGESQQPLAEVIPFTTRTGRRP